MIITEQDEVGSMNYVQKKLRLGLKTRNDPGKCPHPNIKWIVSTIVRYGIVIKSIVSLTYRLSDYSQTSGGSQLGLMQHQLQHQPDNFAHLTVKIKS